jgi:hypothetical protein
MVRSDEFNSAYVAALAASLEHRAPNLDRRIAGVDFVAADIPQANRLTVGIMAMIADEERRLISARTKAALAAAKKRGKQLGGYRGVKIANAVRGAARAAVKARTDARQADLAPVINELKAAGITSLGSLARALTERGIPTARGGSEWSAVQVSRVLSRLDPPAKSRGEMARSGGAMSITRGWPVSDLMRKQNPGAIRCPVLPAGSSAPICSIALTAATTAILFSPWSRIRTRA